MFLKILCLVAAVVSGSAAFAQSDRVEQINRVTEGLNSPNPAVRIATLEDAARSGDRTLRQFALQQALGSSDLTLRSTALFIHMEQNPTILVELVSINLPENDHGIDRAAEFARDLAGAIDLQIRNFDPASGAFLVFSTFSRVHSREGVTVHQGNLNGDRISYQVDLNGLGVSRGDCYGHLRLEGDGALMSGEIMCGRGRTYVTRSNLLR